MSDAQEELEVARARGELSRLMRQNDSLEQELEEMDKKIGLLVQNRISVQDVITDRKKGGVASCYRIYRIYIKLFSEGDKCEKAEEIRYLVPVIGGWGVKKGRKEK